MALSRCQRQSTFGECFWEVSGDDSSNVGKCLTSQDIKLQCSTNSLHRNTKWKVIVHFLGHLM